MDPKLRKVILAALDAGDAIASEVLDPQRNWGDAQAFVQDQHKAVKAARRAMEKERWWLPQPTNCARLPPWGRLAKNERLRDALDEAEKQAWIESFESFEGAELFVESAKKSGEQIAENANCSDGLVGRVADAIEAAKCPHREGPFGGYDYGHNEAFYGPAPEGGRYVIRDFRDPQKNWGKFLHLTNDNAAHEAMFAKMTREHIAQAAIAALTNAAAEHP